MMKLSMIKRFHKLIYDFAYIPPMVKRMSLMLFVFVLGRGLGGDTFFSVYIASLTDSALLVSLMGALLAGVKMVFSLASGNLDDKADYAKMVWWAKWIYVICGVMFFLAGIVDSVWLLLIAVMLNGLGSAILFTTYSYYFRTHSTERNRYTVIGLMYTAMTAAYLIGALFAAALINVLPLPFMYLFVSVFALFSLWWRKRLEIDVSPLSRSLTEHIGLVRQFMIETFSWRPYRRSLELIQEYGRSLQDRLWCVWLIHGLDYIAFLFVPLLAVSYDLSLSQIALLFALMRIPALTSYLWGDIEDGMDYRIIYTIGFVGLAACLVLLSIVNGFVPMVIVGMVMTLLLTIVRPVVMGRALGEARIRDAGAMTGLVTVVSRIWEIIWSVIFGLISAYWGMQMWFYFFAVLLFIQVVLALPFRHYLDFVLTFSKK
jgi:MFS family permease